MGRAARWLRGLLGGKKATAPEEAAAVPAKEKTRWGFVKSFRDKGRAGRQSQAPLAAVVEETRGSCRGKETGASPLGEDEESKHAIAVAAATAAVAEAAVVAAEAAAAVVRLTSSGRCGSAAAYAGVRREGWAAVRIQAAFRGYLARRALRALKGLVKLQALVRGNIVRKQAAETLRCMHALVRVQARARACRALRSDSNCATKGSGRPLPGPATPEKFEAPIRTAKASKSDRPSTLKRNSSKPRSVDVIELDRVHSSGWNWLDQWMEERRWDGREAITKARMDDEKGAKILEVDTGKPHFNHKRRSSSNRLHSSCSTLASDQHSLSFATVPDSPSKDSTTAHLSYPSPSTVDMQQSLSPLRFPVVETVDLPGSPQFFSATSRTGSSRRGPFTPSKSECSQSLFSRYSDFPSYMANTESSRAKVRSQSAPKQRPPEFETSSSVKRSSMHAYGPQPVAQRSSSLRSKFTNKAYPGSGRLDRLGMPIRM